MLALEIEKAEGEDLTQFLRDPQVESITWERWSDAGMCLIKSSVYRMTDKSEVMPYFSSYTFMNEYRDCHWWEMRVTIGDEVRTQAMAVPVDDKVYTIKEAVAARTTP